MVNFAVSMTFTNPKCIPAVPTLFITALEKMGCYSPLKGHAIVLQLQEELYRFMDPNTGVYSYSSLPKLEKALSSYTKAMYPEFNLFGATQFMPIL
jgi:hypothetical protein